jgi:hypothetical protein
MGATKEHDCCYYQCPEEGTVHIGANGGDSHWICSRHLDKWTANRARFLADGGGCEMEELGELLENDECGKETTDISRIAHRVSTSETRLRR